MSSFVARQNAANGSKSLEAKVPRTGERFTKRVRAMMDMFAGPDRNKNIMIAVAVVAVAVIAILYVAGRLPGIS